MECRPGQPDSVPSFICLQQRSLTPSLVQGQSHSAPRSQQLHGSTPCLLPCPVSSGGPRRNPPPYRLALHVPEAYERLWVACINSYGRGFNCMWIYVAESEEQHVLLLLESPGGTVARKGLSGVPLLSSPSPRIPG